MGKLIWLWDYIMCHMILCEKETMALQQEREENEFERQGVNSTEALKLVGDNSRLTRLVISSLTP